MKSSIIFILLLSLLQPLSEAQAQCDSKTSIALKKAKVRDWVRDFNLLEEKYRTLPNFKLLYPFFYDDAKKPKECISFHELQQLSSNIQKVFAGDKNSRAKSFQNAVKIAAERNQPIRTSASTKSNSVTNVSLKNIGVTPLNKSANTQRADSFEVLPREGELTVDTNYSDHTVTKENTSDSSTWQWVSLGLGGLALGLGGLALWLNLKLEQERMYYEQRINTDSSATVHEDSRKRQEKVNQVKINHLEAEIEKLTLTNASLLEELEKSDQKQKSDEIEQNDLTTANPITIAETGAATILPQTKSFFLSTPTPTTDGLCTFLDQRKASFDPTGSLYRFELERSNENMAKFWFENTSGTVNWALGNHVIYLQPACSYTGFNSRATQIETIQPGQAVRQGNVWKITEKARIRFV